MNNSIFTFQKIENIIIHYIIGTLVSKCQNEFMVSLHSTRPRKRRDSDRDRGIRFVGVPRLFLRNSFCLDFTEGTSVGTY